MAGRRADAHGPRLLPALGRAHRPIQAARPAGAQHAPDQRHPARPTSGARSSPSTTSWWASPSTARATSMTGTALDKGGKGTFDRVMRGLDVLRHNKVDYNILTTVHAANQDRGREVYRFLRDECGATFMQFIPIVERATPETLAAANAGWGDRGRLRPLYVLDGSLVTDRTVSPEGYGRFHIDIFEDWVRRDIGTVYVQMFDTALANWYGEGGAHVRAFGDLRAAAGARAQRRPVLLRPLRGAALQAGQHPRAADARHGRSHRSSGSSGRTSGTRSPGTASTATSGSPATAAAPRTASRRRPTASPGSTTCAPATSRSSGTSPR